MIWFGTIRSHITEVKQIQDGHTLEDRFLTSYVCVYK